MDKKFLKKMFGTSKCPNIDFSLQDISQKAQEMAGKLSISGVQPKLSMRLNDKKNLLLSVAEDGRYILKPQTQTFPNLPENEQCCMDIAQFVGINVPEHCLLTLKDGSYSYVVKRFDRKNGQKFHQEDFYQILARKDKYIGSVESIGRKLKEKSAIPGLDVQLFFEMVVFNFLIGNGDAHSKNYSIRYDEDGQIRLSPAYDIVCSKLVIPMGQDSALTINGKNDQLSREDFDKLAEYFNIPEKVRYEKFIHKFNLMIKLINDSKLNQEKQCHFIEIIKERYLRMSFK